MEMDPPAAAKALGLPSYAKAVDAYRKAVGTAASVTAYVVLARGMARELLPHDLLSAARWAASLVRARLETPPPERRTLVIKSAAALLYGGGGADSGLYDDVREYLATRIDPHSMGRLCLGGRSKRALSLEHGDSMTDVFEGVEFKWASVAGQSQHGNGNEYDYGYGYRNVRTESLELSFDAEHTDMALGRYVPFITETVAEARRRESALHIFINEGSSWHGIKHHHPSTFDTLAMDPDLKQSVVADLDRFLKRTTTGGSARRGSAATSSTARPAPASPAWSRPSPTTSASTSTTSTSPRCPTTRCCRGCSTACPTSPSSSSRISIAASAPRQGKRKMTLILITFPTDQVKVTRR
jgi:hypothetical protein